MFADDLKVEFIDRVSIILDKTDFTESEKISSIGKLFVEFDKRNKSRQSSMYVPQPRAKRAPTEYNLFIRDKMVQLKDGFYASKVRFAVASSLWVKK